ncbi:MAG: redoxin domain-containing protein [Solirubrobacterales bacterium]|nr:redoxin domain-containing protein [Solirubrobacterales bacterium]
MSPTRRSPSSIWRSTETTTQTRACGPSSRRSGFPASRGYSSSTPGVASRRRSRAGSGSRSCDTRSSESCPVDGEVVGRPRSTIVLSLVGVGLLVTGCGSTGDGSPSAPAPTAKRELPPGPLRELAAQANQIFDGGAEAFERRVTELRGHPIVVNQWASWCGPCRFEFPFFQRLADRYAGRAAFLGVNSQDSREAAQSFLEDFPVPYPHYFDPDADIARVFEGGRAWPTTAFYDARGELVQTRPGGYASQEDLDADIRRFALGG